MIYPRPYIASIFVTMISSVGCAKRPVFHPESSTAFASNSANGSSSGTNTVYKKAPQIILYTVEHRLDLVVVIDSAVGTAWSQAELAKQLGTFGQTISTALDTQIHFMVGGVLRIPALDSKKIAFINEPVASDNIIGQVNSLFAKNFDMQYLNANGTPQDFAMEFREDVKPEIVMISYGNGQTQGNLATDFDPTNSIKGTVSAVVPQKDSVKSASCPMVAIGQEYIELGRKLNGSVLDVCNADISEIFTSLAHDIIKRRESYKLAQKPVDPAGIEVTMDGKVAPKEIWTYDAASNAILFLRAKEIPNGSKIEIKYDPLN